MRKLILFPCVALLTATVAPATAAPPVTSQVAAPADAQQSAAQAGGGKSTQAATEEKKICKQLDTTGSRLPRRACLTAKEWKQVEAEVSGE